MNPDYLIVGSGLTGATIARHLHDRGDAVVVLERREHLGGNVFDYVHFSGIRVHAYGPHYFRTSSQRIWDYVQRFAEFYPYSAELLTCVDGTYESWPIHADYIIRHHGADWLPSFSGIPRNFEEACLAQMPRHVYEKFIKGYTEKQWGVSCSNIEPDLAERIEVRQGSDKRLKKSTRQGLPRDGYAAFMMRMLKGIPIILNTNYIAARHQFKPKKKTIYTGPIDEFFDFSLGRLAYRGQRRTHQFMPNVTWSQPAAQVNYPSYNDGPHVRVIEWKYLMPASEGIRGTLLTREIPFSPTDPSEYEYPFPDGANRKLYQRYVERAKDVPDVLFCGRLGEYRYYDMDQAIGRAMKIVDSLN